MTTAIQSELGLPATIAEVIHRLDEIVEYSKDNGDRNGYFAALYRQVTMRVRDGIIAAEFQDNARMEKLDVLFANRYLKAYADFKNNGKCSQSWQFAFETVRKAHPLVLQQLLLGMNVHINLDLGIAAAETAAGADIAELEQDFNQINTILAEMLNDVQGKINIVSPWFRLIDRFGGRVDEAVMNFSILKAREHAWQFALNLHAEEEDNRVEKIRKKDAEIDSLGHRILNPGWFLKTILLLVRTVEVGDVRRVILILT